MSQPDLWVVEVQDSIAAALAEHEGGLYVSPPQDREQALELVALLVGRPQSANGEPEPQLAPRHRRRATECPTSARGVVKDDRERRAACQSEALIWGDSDHAPASGSGSNATSACRTESSETPAS